MELLGLKTFSREAVQSDRHVKRYLFRPLVERPRLWPMHDVRFSVFWMVNGRRLGSRKTRGILATPNVAVLDNSLVDCSVRLDRLADFELWAWFMRLSVCNCWQMLAAVSAHRCMSSRVGVDHPFGSKNTASQLMNQKALRFERINRLVDRLETPLRADLIHSQER